MLVRLHDRTEGAARPKGLSCDDAGLRFGGDFALIEAAEGPFGRGFRRRPVDQINRVLSAGYGAPVDLTAREPVLDQIADCLTKGDLSRAQLLALQLRLPDLPDEGATDKLAKAEALLRFNPNHDDQGRFASAPGDGGHPGKTPGGKTYSTAIHLTAGQAAVLGRIIDYGVSTGVRPDSIQIAVNQAFVESTLGLLRSDPDSTATGIFHYIPRYWTHHGLDVFNDADQIKAMYQDLANYRTRFNAGQASGAIPNSLTFEDYIKIRHNIGPYTTRWTGPRVTHMLKDYYAKTATLGFEF